MKKVTSILAAALVLAILLCACGGAKGNGKKLSEVYSAVKSQVALSDMNEFTDVKSLDRFYGISAESVEDFAGGVNRRMTMPRQAWKPHSTTASRQNTTKTRTTIPSRRK